MRHLTSEQIYRSAISILVALLLALGGLILLRAGLSVPVQAAVSATPINGHDVALWELETHRLAVLQVAGLYTWTQDTRADWEQGTMSWLDSATISGSLRLMQRLFEESTTVTPRGELGSGQTKPDIALDPSGNAYAVWEDSRNGNSDIYFAYRAAVSTTWSASVKVNDDSSTAGQVVPAIAVDSSGNAYAMWADERNGQWDIYFATRPAGGSWGANVKVNDDPGTARQYWPDVAVDAGGNAYAVWQDGRSGNNDIYFATRPAGGFWGANVRVNDDSGTTGAVSPAIAVDPSGNAYAVWEDLRNGDGDIYFAHYPAGGSWGANVKVNDDAGTAWQGSPDIGVDSSGNAYIVWNDSRDITSGIYFATRSTEGDWGSNAKVNDSTSDTAKAAIAVGSSGDAYAVWMDYRSGNMDIYFATRPEGGNWGTSVRVDDDPGVLWQWYPAIAVDADGNAYAIWQDERNGNEDIYFATRPAGSTWDDNVRVDDDASGAASQAAPAIAIDPDGNAYAVWVDKRNGNEDIYFAIRSADGHWGTSVQVSDDVGTASQEWPAIAIDASGNAYAVWQDERNGNRDIYFAYRAAISTTWSENEQVNDDAGTVVQYSPVALAVAPGGNVHAAWGDERNGDRDIYFATRPTGGSWGANEKINDDSGTAGQQNPAIAVDASGNVFAVWEDYRNGREWDDADIYFAYRAAISTIWGANVKISDDSGTDRQSNPAIAVDASGSAYAAWTDDRDGRDIYFAIRPAGGYWGTNVQVDDDSGMAGQDCPAITVDTGGNAYAVWLDNRNAWWDVFFATRLAGGDWGINTQVNYAPGIALFPYSAIAVDGDGNIYAVWVDASYGTGHVHFARSSTTPEVAPGGSYTSPELDTEVTAAVWESLTWQGSTPSGTSLTFETRSRIAGGPWSEWEAVDASITSPPGQFLQYRATFSTTSTDVTPRLDQVQITYRSVEVPSAPRFATPCGMTNQISPTLRGWATAGSTVHLYVDGSEVATTVAGTDGAFTLTPHLSTGSHALTATAENDDGIGPASDALDLIVDPSLLYDPINVRAGHWSKDGWQMGVPRDANGCANPDNDWRVWPRRWRKFRVQVPVSYTTSAAVTVTVGTATITLTEESNKLFAGVFQPPLYEGDFIIEVTADGNTTIDDGSTLIDPDGVVYEATGTMSDTIPGVQVTCYYWDDHSGQWVMWDAWTYDQVNPQITLEDGYYSFYVPPGTWRVVAEKEGYPAYTSPDLVVVSTPVRHNIPLGWRIFMPVVLRNH